MNNIAESIFFCPQPKVYIWNLNFYLREKWFLIACTHSNGWFHQNGIILLIHLIIMFQMLMEGSAKAFFLVATKFSEQLPLNWQLMPKWDKIVSTSNYNTFSFTSLRNHDFWFAHRKHRVSANFSSCSFLPKNCVVSLFDESDCEFSRVEFLQLTIVTLSLSDLVAIATFSTATQFHGCNCKFYQMKLNSIRMIATPYEPRG